MGVHSLRPKVVDSTDMVHSRTSVLAVLLVAVAAAALFARVCSFVGPALQQREVDLSMSFFGGAAPAPARAPPPRAGLTPEMQKNEANVVLFGFFLTAFVVYFVIPK